MLRWMILSICVPDTATSTTSVNGSAPSLIHTAKSRPLLPLLHKAKRTQNAALVLPLSQAPIPREVARLHPCRVRQSDDEWATQRGIADRYPSSRKTETRASRTQREAARALRLRPTTYARACWAQSLVPLAELPSTVLRRMDSQPQNDKTGVWLSLEIN